MGRSSPDGGGVGGNVGGAALASFLPLVNDDDVGGARALVTFFCVLCTLRAQISPINVQLYTLHHHNNNNDNLTINMHLYTLQERGGSLYSNYHHIVVVGVQECAYDVERSMLGATKEYASSAADDFALRVSCHLSASYALVAASTQREARLLGEFTDYFIHLDYIRCTNHTRLPS
jgi:hypothetical protein